MLTLCLNELRDRPRPASPPARAPTQTSSLQAEQDYGRLRACPADRLMMIDGKPVSVGSRAFDLLLALLESSGSLVSKDELIRRVWPTTNVDESNLRIQIAALRRAMGPVREAIRTIPGRGYIFAPALARLHPAPVLSPSVAASPPANDAGHALDKLAAGHLRAAVIDGDEDARRGLKALLEHLGVPTDGFASSAEFSARQGGGTYLCAIVEQWLPGGDGLDLLRDLLKDQSATHVIVTSAYPDVYAAVQAMKMGACDFLPKPVQSRDVVEAVLGLLGVLGPAQHSAAAC